MRWEEPGSEREEEKGQSRNREFISGRCPQNTRCIGRIIATEKIQKCTLASRRTYLHFFIHTKINDTQIQTHTETATDEGHEQNRYTDINL